MLLKAIEKMVSTEKTTTKQKMVFKTKDCTKTENDKIIDDVQYSCDEYKNLIDKILTFGLMDGDSQILIIKNLP